MTDTTKPPTLDEARHEALALRDLKAAGWPSELGWSRASEVVVVLIEGLERAEAEARELWARPLPRPALPDDVAAAAHEIVLRLGILRGEILGKGGCRACGGRWRQRTVGTERYIPHAADCPLVMLEGEIRRLTRAIAAHEARR